MSHNELVIISRDTLAVSPEFTFVQESHPQPTIAKYGIHHRGQRVGRTTLMERGADQEIGFDVHVTRTGHNLGIRALQALAVSLGEEGFDLVTAGVRVDARGYWEHQAKQGRVVAVNPARPQTTNYKVLEEPSREV